jgi:PKD repeat protein
MGAARSPLEIFPRIVGLAAAISLALAVPGQQRSAAQELRKPDGTASIATPVPLLLPTPVFVSLVAVPSYGVAPLTVGFIVQAVDPDNIGFVSYQWNFGDGKVSTLPPLLVYNTYRNSGSYLVTLTAVTADGRSASAFAGVLVRSR